MDTKRQTELLNRLHEMFQSIAITAVKIQKHLGNPDAVFDACSDIEDDMQRAIRINTELVGN